MPGPSLAKAALPRCWRPCQDGGAGGCRPELIADGWAAPLIWAALPVITTPGSLWLV